MRIGLLADIHGDVANLRRAIRVLRRERVDRFIVLGDLIFNSRNAADTVSLLRDCGAVGVWGNHELGLCVEPSEEIRACYADSVLEFFGTLNAQLEYGDFLFSHTLPDQDPLDPAAYYLGPRPYVDGALDQCFSRFSHRVILVGHFHRWFAATTERRLAWNGTESFDLQPDTRYFFIIHAVMSGWTAIIDDERNLLVPIRI